LIDHVPAGGGSTMVWPASHSRVFHLMSQQLNNGRQAHVRNNTPPTKQPVIVPLLCGYTGLF
jgi:hypothetical protein